jgi:phosphoadenosine phosphosulfate reductase
VLWEKYLKATKEEWIEFAQRDACGRKKFFKEHNIQYKNVPRCKGCRHVFFHCVCDDPNYWKLMKKRNNLFNASFERKLKHSQKLVKKVLREHKGEKIYIAYSGGIDSECCIQLFKDAIIDGRVQVIWGDTLVEFPETRKRIQELENEFGIKVIVTRPNPPASFPYIVKTYGLPLYSRSSSDKEKRKATEQCCYLLKKRPMNKITKGCDVLVLGLRLEENQNRTLGIYHTGDYFRAKKRWTVYPIAFWNEDDVWTFQAMMEFNFNKIYRNTNCDKFGFYELKNGKEYHIRTGCWACPQSINSGYLEWLEKYYLPFYNTLWNNLGLKRALVIIEEAKQKLKDKKIIPCGEKL